MSTKNIAYLRNSRARIFDQTSRINRNRLPFTRKNGHLHYLSQFNLCFNAFSIGHQFLVEAVIDTNKPNERLRADFVDLDEGIVVEVAENEHEESLERKKKIWKKYGLEMVIFDDFAERVRTPMALCPSV